MKNFLFLLSLIIFIASCVPNRKIVYLQDKDYQRGKYLKDSVLEIIPYQYVVYKLQPEDILSVNVRTITADEYNFLSDMGRQQNVGAQQGQTLLLSGYLIDNTGHIELPVIGKVQVAGLSVSEAESKIRELIGGYLQDPHVTVRMVNFRFTVLGEVRSPGINITYYPKLTVMDAIAMSGDLTEYADRRNIKVLRHIDGEAKVFYLNVLDEDIVRSPYYYVQPNDLIIVKPLKVKVFNTYVKANWTFVVSALSTGLLIWQLTRSR